MGSAGNNSGNYLNVFGGTSASCPQVAGIVALMLSINNGLTETEVVCRLRTTATDLGSAGFDNSFGYGLVNAYYATAFATLLGMEIEDETITKIQKYASPDHIYVGPSTTFANGSEVELVSNQTIKFKAGFHAMDGSKAHAYISNNGFCGTGPLRLANSNFNEEAFNKKDSSNSLLNNDESFNFDIIPNPTSGNFKIIVKNALAPLASVSIVNLVGSTFYEDFRPNNKNIEFDISSLTSGLYIVKLNYNGKILCKKIIKD